MTQRVPQNGRGGIGDGRKTRWANHLVPTSEVPHVTFAPLFAHLRWMIGFVPITRADLSPERRALHAAHTCIFATASRDNVIRLDVLLLGILRFAAAIQTLWPSSTLCHCVRVITLNANVRTAGSEKKLRAWEADLLYLASARAVTVLIGISIFFLPPVPARSVWRTCK